MSFDLKKLLSQDNNRNDREMLINLQNVGLKLEVLTFTAIELLAIAAILLASAMVLGFSIALGIRLIAIVIAFVIATLLYRLILPKNKIVKIISYLFSHRYHFLSSEDQEKT